MNRTRVIKFRVTEDEYTDLTARADRAGLSVSEALRLRTRAHSLTVSPHESREERAFKYGLTVEALTPPAALGVVRETAHRALAEAGLLNSGLAAEFVVTNIASPQEGVVTPDEVGAKDRGCPHGRKESQWCPLCDG